MDNFSEEYYAAVDLGSNSFHMAIAQYDGKSFHVIGKLKEKVQLADGLSSENVLSQEAIERGLSCIKLFSERLNNIPKDQIKIVATFTLRQAKNAHVFIEQAEKILSVKIEILPGIEEARLIYNGVSHNHPDIERALVIDIGGGSTEIILGHKFKHTSLDSLPLGCVTYKRFFPNNVINEHNFQRALLSASLELSPVESRYIRGHWDHCIGSSGSIEAIYNVIHGFGIEDTVIRLEHLEFLKTKLLEIGSIDNIRLEGLSNSRVSTFVTGLVILMALFESFQIDKMYISNASLREGILLELENELKGNDNRDQTVSSLSARFNIDIQYGQAIKRNAQTIFNNVADMWGIYDPHFKNLLDWSCLLHEIGLSISFSKMRFHSAHIIQYADMPGFSQQTKDSVAAIIKAQNKKIHLHDLDEKYEPKQGLLALVQILRLSILFNIKRNSTDISELKFNAAHDNKLTISIPKKWEKKNKLLIFELEKEQAYLNFHNIELDWKVI